MGPRDASGATFGRNLVNNSVNLEAERIMGWRAEISGSSTQTR